MEQTNEKTRTKLPAGWMMELVEQSKDQAQRAHKILFVSVAANAILAAALLLAIWK